MPKVSIYTPTYNCGKYLETAIESVLSQTYQDFELIIIDDGSTDNTELILEKYKDNPKIKIIKNKKNFGFVKSAIKAIKLSRGEYIMRLDADDYLDENALMIMTNILDKHPEIGMVYPDYFQINKKGEIIDYFRKKKLGQDFKLLDLPALGACTMMRKSCYQVIGGYRDDIRMQDNYDLWLKFIAKFKPYNINLPLFYYRRHRSNISNRTKKILQTRRYIKEKFLQGKNKGAFPKILAIIPTRSKFSIYPDFPFRKLAGKPVIYYSISAIKKLLLFKKPFLPPRMKIWQKKPSNLVLISYYDPKSWLLPMSDLSRRSIMSFSNLKKKKNIFPILW